MRKLMLAVAALCVFAAMAMLRPVETDTALVQTTVSIGIALFPEHAVAAADLMRPD